MQGRQMEGWIVVALAASLILAGTAGAGSIFDEDLNPPPKPPAQAAPPMAPTAPPPAPSDTSAPIKTPRSVFPSTDVVLPPAPAVSHAIPSALDRDKSRKLFKEVFAEKMKDAAPASRRALAQELLDQIPASADKPADQYVLASGAIGAAEDGQSLDLAFRAVDMMVSLFDIDPLAAKNQATMAVLNAPGASPDNAANIQLATEIEAQQLRQDDFVDARRILSAILRRASRSGDRELSTRMQGAIRDLDATQAAWEGVRLQLERLKTTPADPAGNFAVGSFFCFMKGQWERGLPYLARGENAAAKSAANAELLLPADSASPAVASVADAWWALAAQQAATRRAHILQHAGLLYQRAQPNLSGLQLILAQKRLASIGPLDDVAGSHDTQTVPTSSAAQTNLLRLVDPKLDALSGEWKIEGGGLGVDPKDIALVRILYAPPMEYDFTVTFTRRQFRGGVGIVFSHGNALGEYQIAIRRNTLMGFAILNGKKLDADPLPMHCDMVLSSSHLYDVVIHVRNRGVSVSIDGQLVAEHPTDWTDLSVDDPATIGQALGLRDYDGKYKFEAIDIREITGQGQASPRQK